MAQLFKHLLTIHAADYLVQHSKLDDVNTIRGRSANVTYGDYEKEGWLVRFRHSEKLLSPKKRNWI